MRKYASVKRKHNELIDKTEQEVWKWYWDVKLTPHHFRQKKSNLWRHYDWMFLNEVFGYKPSGYVYDLFIPSNIEL